MCQKIEVSNLADLRKGQPNRHAGSGRCEDSSLLRK